MARAFPRSRFLGYDLLDDHIATARDEAADWKLDNIRFETRDVATLDVEERFDMVTAFDAIHDQADPDGVLRIVAKALRPGGRFFMVDTSASRELEKNRDHVLGPLLYTVSCMHCMTVSLAHGGAGLGAAWGKELACEMLESAGLTVEKVEPLPDDHPLRHLPNAVYTPHIAGSQGTELARMSDWVCDEVERFASGRPQRNQITRDMIDRIA